MLRPDLEPVRELRASRALVCELADEQRERLGVSGDPQRARVDRVKSRVVDQPGGHAAKNLWTSKGGFVSVASQGKVVAAS
jgi:hypothetical protein